MKTEDFFTKIHLYPLPLHSNLLFASSSAPILALLQQLHHLLLSSLPGTTTVTGKPVQDGHLPRDLFFTYTHTQIVIIIKDNRARERETETHTHTTTTTVYWIFFFRFSFPFLRKISNTYFTFKHLTPSCIVYYNAFLASIRKRMIFFFYPVKKF
jgi:hypothetical protein